MGIDWNAFLLVAVVSIVASCFVVAVYSTGLRLWSTADAMLGKYTVRDDGTVESADTGAFPDPNRLTPAVRALRALAVFCFAVCAASVLYGIYLIVPQFH